MPESVASALSADVESRSLLMSGDGWRLVKKRLHASIAVIGLDKTGASITLLLAAAGVGTIVVSDDRVVTGRDLGQVYTNADIGRRRDAALLTHAPQGDTRFIPWSEWDKKSTLAAAVIAGGEVADPEITATMTGLGIAHYPVTFTELSAVCGPWIQPMAGACSHCIGLAKTDDDPAWPALATQKHSRRVLDERGHDQLLSITAASFAASQVLSAIEGNPPEPGTGVEFRLPTMEPLTHTWPVHERCPHHGEAPERELVPPQAIEESRHGPLGG